MSDMTTADVAFSAARRLETMCVETEEPMLPARHVIGAMLTMIAATILALLMPVL